MGAKSKPTETLSLADIGVEPDRVGVKGSRTTVVALAPPPSKGDQVKVEDDGSAAERLVDWLVERKLL
jgi:electron transfer flavoprotein beta subunit